MIYFINLGVVLFCYMTFWFVVSLVSKKNDVADVAWGLGFVVLAWVSFSYSGDFYIRAIVVNILVSIWGLRLARHIYSRNKGRPEDYRYAEWRKSWGKWFYIRSFFQIYMLQGALLFLISIPVLLINKNIGNNINILDAFGFLVWGVGFCFESVGDAQLGRFIKDPNNKGKLMKGGLWAYTRHPNYFGEITQWWGIFLVALSVPAGTYSIIGPLTITTLILKVSGIPLLEKKMEENPEFAEYKRQTSMLIPWFKKS